MPSSASRPAPRRLPSRRTSSPCPTSAAPRHQRASQNDLTQFGRDDTDANVFKLFWSWDATDDWAGTGQTGDACALFDTNGDGNINFVVCVRVSNPGGDTTTVTQTAGSPFVFSCDDAKNDRCSQPTGPLPYTPTQIQSGAITASGAPLASPPASLVTNTDPFLNLLSDQNWPNDTTIEVVIQKTFLPADAVLVNVCSYPRPATAATTTRSTASSRPAAAS